MSAMGKEPVIAVTGARGKTGRAVVRALAARGAHVRGLVRKGTPQSRLGLPGAHDDELPGVEWVEGDMRAPDTLRALLADAVALYHICPNMAEDEFTIGQGVIAALLASGARASGARLVFHSVLHPQTSAMRHHWEKLRVEERILDSGLEYTILQPSAYMQNMLAQRRAVLEDSIYDVPYSTSTRLGMVDLIDVAEAAATVLTEPGHAGAIYELSGGEALSAGEIAAEMSAVVGNSVVARAIGRGEWETDARRAGLSEYAVRTLLAMFAYYEANGFWGNPQVLTMLLGRRPNRVGEFLAREFAAGAGSSR